MTQPQNTPTHRPTTADSLLWEYFGLGAQILALIGHLDERDLARYQLNSDRLVDLLSRMREVRDLYIEAGGAESRLRLSSARRARVTGFLGS
jgi:hypothetical protein